MAELTPMERLQPCLLDRLTDEEPQSKKESRERRIVSLRRYRQAVRRDLAWLLNASAHPPWDDIDEFAEASRSVLNYGIPDLSGLTASGVNADQLERQLVQAIQVFEPRIVRSSLSVQAVVTADEMTHNAIAFEIQGELWAQPMPDPLYVTTEVDLETGECHLKERLNG